MSLKAVSAGITKVDKQCVRENFSELSILEVGGETRHVESSEQMQKLHLNK